MLLRGQLPSALISILNRRTWRIRVDAPRRYLLSFLLFIGSAAGCTPTVERDSRALAQIGAAFMRAQAPAPFIPEYDSPLDRVVVSLVEEEPDFHHTLKNLVQALPGPARIVALYDSEELRRAFERSLQISPGRIKFVQLPTGTTTSWSQDYAKPIGNRLIVPLSYLGARPHNLADPANAFLDSADLFGAATVRAPLEFAGGNLLLIRDRAGRRIVLSGADNYLATAETYRRLGQTIDESRYLELLLRAFGADLALIAGSRNSSGTPEPQSRWIYHLDQFVLPLADGVVALQNVTAPPKHPAERELLTRYLEAFALPDLDHDQYLRLDRDARREFLQRGKQLGVEADDSPEYHEMREAFEVHEARREVESTRRLLAQLGFQIVDLVVSEEQFRNYQSYANSIVYRDPQRSRRQVLMPEYPESTELNVLNRGRLTALGFEVELVPELGLFRSGGNLHCLILRI